MQKKIISCHISSGQVSVLRRLCLLLVFSLCLTANAWGELGSSEGAPIRLGINYPLTGPYSVEGLDQIRAARMAVDEINYNGGLLGRSLELLPRDSSSDVLLSEINVRELIEAGCVMIFGGASSDVAITAGNICQQYQIPFFGTLTYSTATTLENAHRVSFRECSDSWMAAQLMAPWLNSRYKGKRYFYITADYTWGWTTEASMREVTGTENTEAYPRVLTPLGTTDFSNALRQAAVFNPDVLVLVLFGKDLGHALKQASTMGLRHSCQIVVPNLTLGMAERAGVKSIGGVVGTVPWTWQVPDLEQSARGRDFVDNFIKRYRRYPSTAGASAYSIVFQYKSAVERAGSTRTEDVVRALEGYSYSLLKGQQTWRPLDHQNVQTVYMVRGNQEYDILNDPLRQNYFHIIGHMEGEKLVRAPEDWKRLRREAGLPPKLELFGDETP